MQPITKKRTKAFLIDLAISTAVTAGVEYFLRKKVKSEAVHVLLTPTIVMWTLEYGQLRRTGQTVGYRKMGLELKSTEGPELTAGQIMKRIGYRDTVSFFDYLKNREKFEGQGGAALSHDRFSNTVVKEL